MRHAGEFLSSRADAEHSAECQRRASALRASRLPLSDQRRHPLLPAARQPKALLLWQIYQQDAKELDDPRRPALPPLVAPYVASGYKRGDGVGQVGWLAGRTPVRESWTDRLCARFFERQQGGARAKL